MNRRDFLAQTGALAAAAAFGSRASAQSAAPVRARVGIIPIIGTAPIFIAEKEGFLKERGVELTVTTFESGPNMIQACGSGRPPARRSSSLRTISTRRPTWPIG